MSAATRKKRRPAEPSPIQLPDPVDDGPVPRTRRKASPFGRFPAWRAAFAVRPVRSFFDDRVAFAVPICTDCGRKCPADGTHRCRVCRGESGGLS